MRDMELTSTNKTLLILSRKNVIRKLSLFNGSIIKSFINGSLTRTSFLQKNTLGFQLAMQVSGYVTIDEVESGFQKFIEEVNTEDEIKLLTFVFMGHGSENDMSV